MDFSPDFPELSFTSRKKVVTEHWVQIKDHKFIVEDLLERLYDAVHWSEERGTPIVWKRERELFLELGIIDQYENWIEERVDRFFNYIQDLFEKLEENEDPDYYLDEE